MIVQLMIIDFCKQILPFRLNITRAAPTSWTPVTWSCFSNVPDLSGWSNSGARRKSRLWIHYPRCTASKIQRIVFALPFHKAFSDCLTWIKDIPCIMIWDLLIFYFPRMISKHDLKIMQLLFIGITLSPFDLQQERSAPIMIEPLIHSEVFMADF